MIRRALPKRAALAQRRKQRSPSSQWFWDHYDWAAGQIAGFCETAGITLEGAEIADIGCGDGIMALGVSHRVKPKRLAAFDIVATDQTLLLERARAEGVVTDALPGELEFVTSTATGTPASDDSFDFVYSWSAFEHIAEPVSVLREIRRILRPTGHFFLQLWPFYRSAKGSHLWDWFPADFHHLLDNDREIVEEMNRTDREPDRARIMGHEFERLNRVTVDQLQRAVLAAGFDVRWLQLQTERVHLAPELARYSWCDLGISGIQLIALPSPAA